MGADGAIAASVTEGEDYPALYAMRDVADEMTEDKGSDGLRALSK
jgi:hypothetical protein